MAPISEARKRANDEYLKTQDEIKVRVPKGKKAEIKSHADKYDNGSVNGFIKRANDNQMERDNAEDNQ